MNKIKNLRRNKKGFTLVEVIVVLVILAILIAIAVPSVMKYIDDANDAKYEAQARGAMIATEAAYVKDYAPDKKIDKLDVSSDVKTEIGITEATFKVEAFTDVAATKDYTATETPNNIKAYKVTIGSTVVTIVVNGAVTVE